MALRRIPFAKIHGLGNDFLLVSADDLGGMAPGDVALRACDRHTGVGADGLVTLGHSGTADAVFRIYNSDGSEATLSGNAMRCAAARLLSQRGESDARKIALETRVGVRELFFRGRDASRWIFRAEMGAPLFALRSVPFHPPKPPGEPAVRVPLPVGDSTVPVTVLFMGNPQTIVFLEDVELADWMSLGPEIERHPFFPDRTNVGFVRVLSESLIEARFWERGAGHTLASGTGSCACAVASHLAGRTGRRVTVRVERGEMQVAWRDDGMVELTGPAEITAEGCFQFDDDSMPEPIHP